MGKAGQVNADGAPTGRFPPWLKRSMPTGPEAAAVAKLLHELGLSTVCAGARCPNQAECFSRGTATFLILGDRCTRHCRFCAIPSTDRPAPPRQDEPEAVAEACVRLGLRHVVITSVTRDDLPDGGAGHFAETIQAVRRRLPQAVIEVLTPDFAGNLTDVDTVLGARPDVFNHNVETVPRLYPLVRCGGDPQTRGGVPKAEVSALGALAFGGPASYERSLGVLAHAAGRGDARGQPHVKSGLMLGLGEEAEEVRQVLKDLRGAGCEIVTIGQYLSPSREHLPVARFVEPAEFEAWESEARAMGFRAVASGPFVRSSYLAENLFMGILP